MAIPKIIHYCWLSDEPYPEVVQYCIATWKKHMPNYEFRLWDQQQFDIHSVPWVEQAVKAKKWAFAADYIRLYALYNYGGIYLDSDVEVIKPFDDLLDLPYFLGKEHTRDFTDNIIEAATIGSSPNLPMFKDCLAYYENRSFVKGENIFDTTLIMPFVLYQVINHNTAIKEISKKEDFEKNNPAIQIFSPDFFSPKNLRTQKIEATSNTYSIHYFNGSWLTPQQIKHIKMRTRLCNRYGERLGEISSSLFALFSSVKIDGIKNTLKKLLEKIKFVFQSPK